ncbi:MAG: hypothetical protein ACNFW9_05015 [Candidatus Kerfeldbacteria bacterium]
MNKLVTQEMKTSLAIIASRIITYLNNLGIGHGEQKKFTSLVSPTPFFIDQFSHKQLINRGPVIREWIETTNLIYHQSLHHEEMQGLRDLLETGLSPEMLPYHRRIFKTGPIRAPLFMRMDQPDFGKAVEAQTPGSGWGYYTAMAELYKTDNVIGREFVKSVAKHLRLLSGKESSRVVHLLHKVDFYKNEAEHFAKAIRNEGIDFTICVRSIPENIESYDIVLRHYMEELGQYEGWQNLLELYIQGSIEIEPPPSVLTDHKVSLMLPFDSQTMNHYSNNVRNLFPITHLVDPFRRYQINLNGNRYLSSLSLFDIINLKNSERPLALKYSGLNPKLRAGGRGVYNLAMSDQRNNVKKMMEKVIAGYIPIEFFDEKPSFPLHCPSEPWLLQNLCLKRFPFIYLDAKGKIVNDELNARINPFYAFPLNGGSELIGCIANLRNSWKVHGQVDSVTTILAVKKRRYYF